MRDAIVEDGATIDGALVEHSIVGARATIRGRAQRHVIGDDSLVTI